MTHVQTVRAPVAVDPLGPTLMHEHVFILGDEIRQNFPDHPSCFIDWFSHEGKVAAQPNWKLTHISDDVLPALRARGVTDEQLTTMLVDNPCRYFSGEIT